MRKKYREAIDEVNDEINKALEDPKGIVSHQRRLTFSISMGMSTLIENYFDELDILKSGARVNHDWFKKKKENIRKRLSNQIICPLDKIKNINKILDLAYEIEKERNLMAYGKPVSEGKLKKYIQLYLELKDLIKNV